MVLKRNFVEEDRLGFEDNPLRESKRRFSFDTVVRDVMKGLSIQELVSRLEPLLRKVVREELERVIPYIHSVPRPLCNRIEAADSRGWQLHFTNKLPNTLFTGNKIETEDLRVVIIDANSKRIVTNGPLSSVKIEILVLDGDFGSDEKEDWTEDEFDACLIREREGKRPLVIGDLQITLRDGVGYFGDITFTDNSSWTRSRTFRLGAKVVRSTCNEEKIREARSTSFVVKDHRGELYKKHHPPSLSSEVWRLEKVGKDGAFHNRLASHKIETVQDFLRQFVTDPSFLRSVLGNNMSSRTWDIIVQHAQSCTLDDKKYTYYNAERQIGLLFNSIYKVIGVTFDGQNYQSVENLSAPDKASWELSKVDGEKERYECTYNGNGEVPLLCAAGAFLSLAIAMVMEHAFLLVAVSKATPPALIAWNPDSSRTVDSLTWHAAFFFVTTWICFAVAEVILMIGIGVESGHLTKWSRPKSSCLVVRQGLFLAGGVFGLTTVFFVTGLYLTALRAQRLEQEEEDIRREVLDTAILYASPPRSPQHRTMPNVSHQIARPQQEHQELQLHSEPPGFSKSIDSLA